MNIPSLDLFVLIKNMSLSEKRYFKVYASLHEANKPNNYVVLFDAIEKQKEYDENALIKKLSNTKIPRQLAANKHYLYKLLLRSLVNFNQQKSVSAQIKTDLISAEILQSKGLFDQANKLLKKTERKARKHFRLHELLEIMTAKQAIIAADIGIVDEQLNTDTYNTQVGTLQQLERLFYYKSITNSMAIFTRREGLTAELTRTIAKKYKSIIRIIENEQSDDVLDVRYWRYLVLIGFYIITDNNEKLYRTSKENMDMVLKADDDAFTPVRKFSTVSNFLLACEKASKYDEYENALSVLFAIGLKSKSLNTEMLQSSYYRQLRFYAKQGNTDKGIATIKNYEKTILKNNRIIINAPTIIYQKVSYLYFLNSEYNNALKWAVKLAAYEYDKNIRQDIVRFTPLYSALIHYELGNDLFLYDYIKKVGQRLSNSNEMNRLEEIAYSLIKKLVKSKTRKAKKELFGASLSEFEKIKKYTKDEENFLTAFDLHAWLISHVRDVSMKEVVAKKFASILKD